MLQKTCSRCGRLMPYGNTYCETCKPIMDKIIAERIAESKRASNRKYNKGRVGIYTRFYNSKDWRVLSLSRLQYDNYKCLHCGKIASEVDHIIPIQSPDGWELRLDFNNLQSLCLDCHNKKHNRFVKKRNTKRI